MSLPVSDPPFYEYVYPINCFFRFLFELFVSKLITEQFKKSKECWKIQGEGLNQFYDSLFFGFTAFTFFLSFVNY